jgi:hypothetical protein
MKKNHRLADLNCRWEQDSEWDINQYDDASAMPEIKSDFNVFHKEHPSEAD